MSVFNKLLSNEDGNFAIMFAVGGAMLATGMAFALDIAGMTSMRQDLQSNIDMATLSAVVQVSTDKTQSNANGDDNSRRQEYEDAFKGALKANGFNLNGLSPTFSTSSGALTVEASIPYEFRFGGLINKKSTSINVLSKVSLPTSGAPVEIALVLDNTRSMLEDGKMDALKTGAREFIDAVENSESGSKIALVPFARYVNVGRDKRGEPWLEVPFEYSTEITWQQATHSGGTCTEETRTRWVDGVEEEYTSTRCEDQTTTYEEKSRTEETSWQGCVGARDDGRHLTDGPYTSIDTRIQGLLMRQPYQATGLKYNVDTECPRPITVLTDEYDMLRQRVVELYGRDTTYIPLGLNWGRRVLSAEAPFTETDTTNPKKQIMVLMTDGDNMARINTGPQAEANYNAPPYIYSFSEQQQEAGKVPEQANADTAALCETIKNEGTELYTIAFQVTDPITLNLLENCASTGRHYFNSTSNEALVETFDNIASGLGGDIRIMR